MTGLANRMGLFVLLGSALLGALGADLAFPEAAEAQRWRSRRNGAQARRAHHVRARQARFQRARAPREDAPRIAVALFVGPRSDVVRASVIRALDGRRDVEVISERELERAADRIGGPPETRAEFEEFARAAHADAVVFGQVRRRRGWRATVRVRDSGGEVVAEETFGTRQIRTLTGEIRRELWDAVSDSIPEAGSNSDSGSESDSDPGSDSDSDSDSDSGSSSGEDDSFYANDDEAPPESGPSGLELAEDQESRRASRLDPELFPDAGSDDEFGEDVEPSEHTPLQAAAGLRFFHRSFTFVDDASGMLRPYTLPLGPEVALAADWYPAAHVRNDALENLGLTVSFEHAIGLSSTGPSGESYPTSAYGWGVGLRYRVPISRSEISASLAYGRHGFSVDQAEGAEPAPAMANVTYDALRAGLALRVAVSEKIALYGAGTYFMVFSPGDIASESYFPGATASGLEAAVGGGYALSDRLEARVVVDWRRYTLTFDPASNRNQVAGATDQYFGGNVSLAFTLDPPGRGAPDLLAEAGDDAADL